LAAFLEERSSLPLSIILTEISLLKKRGHYSKVEHYVHVSVCVCACVCVCITITVACTTNTIFSCDLPPVNVHITGKSPFSMGKSTISMAIFNSFLLVYQAGYIWNLKPKQNSRTSAEPWHLAQSRPEQKQSAYDLPSLSAGGRAWLVDWLVMIGGFKWVAFERKMGICMFWLLCVFIVWYIYIHIYICICICICICVCVDDISSKRMLSFAFGTLMDRYSSTCSIFASLGSLLGNQQISMRRSSWDFPSRWQNLRVAKDIKGHPSFC
jgi:hypothetical protein